MAVLSVLRNIQLISKVSSPGLSAGIGSRWMSSHKRVMVVRPSNFQWKKFWDAVHFYTFLGVIPLTTLVFFVSIFIGPAQLAEIPEGYEPKCWEYYKHPIQRFFARYINPPYQQNYEKKMHMMKEEWEKQQLRILERKVKALMAQRDDYQAWYYRPFTGKYVRQYRRESDEVEDNTGIF